MIDGNGREPEHALLVGIRLAGDTDADCEDRITELEQLAYTAGATVAGRVIQARTAPDSVTFVGSGKAAEIGELAAGIDADLLIFDNELTSIQQRNVERITEVRTIDRTQLILDIFAARAQSREGQLQVQLAQLHYLLPRLTGRGVGLSRLGGGIGTRGPGETKLETDRRRIRTRIRLLEAEIDSLRKHRRLRREGRRASGMSLAALVGYTNAGKSTVMNALTAGGAFVEDRLFATLDPLTRRVVGPRGSEFLLADTVGFISRLPHHLVAAFRATLEEITEADLLVHVVDCSHPRAVEQRVDVDRVLAGLGASEAPRIIAYNKIDRIDRAAIFASEPQEDEVFISARTGENLDLLVEKIWNSLEAARAVRRVNLTIPYAHSGVVSELHDSGRVIAVVYGADGITVDAELDAVTYNRVLHRLNSGEGPDGCPCKE